MTLALKILIVLVRILFFISFCSLIGNMFILSIIGKFGNWLTEGLQDDNTENDSRQ